LGFLGVITLILIIYAVVAGATAGNEDKASQAKKILIGAIIGLVIIMISFAVATFIVNNLYNATGATG
jgi:hypothetical protein